MTTRAERAAVPAASRAEVVALAAGLTTVVLWGSAFVAIRDAGEAFSPGSLALGRLLVSVLVLGSAAAIRREPLPGRRDLLSIAAFGVLWLGVYSVCLNEAEQRVDAGTAAMIVSIGPIAIALLAGLVLGEGFPRWLFLGGAVAFSGCAVIGLSTSREGTEAVLGVGLLLVAVAGWATAVVLQKPVLARVSPLQVTWLGCVAGAIACLPFAPGLGDDLGSASASAIGLIVYLGVAPTALGFALWTSALRPDERRPPQLAHVHRAGGGDRPRLDAARRDAARARRGGRRALPRRRRGRAPTLRPRFAAGGGGYS